jgi:predicted dithiol-disulfide oxidoreductase (DUF899 family)
VSEIARLEKEIFDLTKKLEKMRKEATPKAVPNYKFKTLTGETSLLEMFGNKETLFVIHNMGQGCRYCTLWGDGLNAFVSHLESTFAVAMVSKDSPEVQRTFANSRGWRFSMASHGGGAYISEQSVMEGENNMPGIVCYVRKGNEVFRKNSSIFGPSDQFCSLWSVVSLAGFDEESWVPQYNYWQRPTKLDDGGNSVL